MLKQTLLSELTSNARVQQLALHSTSRGAPAGPAVHIQASHRRSALDSKIDAPNCSRI
jgi:hypothetical protein